MKYALLLYFIICLYNNNDITGETHVPGVDAVLVVHEQT